MRAEVLAIACALVACDGAREVTRVESAAAPAAGSPATAAPRGPHSAPSPGAITEIAVTEAGDAALTIDVTGAVRLWPSLDNRRKLRPVPVAASAPAMIALARARRDLLAAIVDEAGAAQLIVLGYDGAIRSRTQLAGDAAIEQIVAFGEGMLVRRADQTIEWCDATGTATARLAPIAGERIAAIAVRHGTAVALIGDDPTNVGTVRTLATGGRLAWGDSLTLPQMVRASSAALSPSGRRLAAVHAGKNAEGGVMEVYELAPSPHAIAGASRLTRAVAVVGFIDDGKLAIQAEGNALDWWIEAVPADPWNAVPASPRRDASAGGFAVADGIVVTGYASALAISDAVHIRYLGWKTFARGDLIVSGGRLWVRNDKVLTLLDDNLAEVRSVDISKLRDDAMIAIPVGDHHIILTRSVQQLYVFELVDLDRPVTGRVVLGTFWPTNRLVLDGSAHTLAIVLDNSLDVPRWRLDLAATRATPLPPLRLEDSSEQLWLFDGGRFDGVVAVSVGSHDKDRTLAFFAAPEQEGFAPIRQTAARPVPNAVAVVDAAGTSYERTIDLTNHLIARRGNGRVTTVSQSTDVETPVPSRDTLHVAVINPKTVKVLDDQGVRLWQVPLWGAISAVYTRDDRRIIVRTLGGLVALDAAHGSVVATSCGWEFGVHDVAPTTETFGEPTVCEDPMLQ